MASPAFLQVAPSDKVSAARLLGGAALLVWSAALAIRKDPWTFLDWVNLPFHEAGHLFLLPFGETLHFLGGTLFQLLVPLSLAVWFLAQARPFPAALCFWWFGQSHLGIAVYMADARDLKLPLVGGGENDWNQLFYQWGLLGEDKVRAVSQATHNAGVFWMTIACLWMIFLSLPPAHREELAAPLTRKLPLLGRLCCEGED